MANFQMINRLVKKEYPTLDVEVLRGDGYVYFSGLDGEKIESIYVNPSSVTTNMLASFVMDSIREYLQNATK